MQDIDLGQVFTPKVVADYMVNLFTLKENAEVLEPCFGDGALLDSMVRLTNYKIQGIELDEALFNKVINNNKFKSCNLYKGNFLEHEDQYKYDGIIMNPPYIRQEKIDNLEKFGITKQALQKKLIFKNLAKTSNMYMYFIIKALELLKENGELIVIFPSTWLNSKNADNFKSEISKIATITKRIYVKGNVFGEKVLVDVLILKIVKSKLKLECEELHMEYKGEELLKCTEVEILHNSENHIKLNQYCEIRRGITTGYNKLFVGKFCNESFGDNIEKIISSPRDIYGYSTKDCRTDDILIIKKDFKYLEEDLKIYLTTAIEEIVKKQKPKTLVKKIENKQQWYKINTYESKGIIFGYIIREKMKFIMNESEYNIRDNFYIMYPKIDKMLLFGLLNNYYTFSRLEKVGKHYGGGVLKIQKYDLDNIMLTDIKLLSEKDKEEIKLLSYKLIESNDEKIIYDITKVISKYENVDINTIHSIYINQRIRRLAKE